MPPKNHTQYLSEQQLHFLEFISLRYRTNKNFGEEVRFNLVCTRCVNQKGEKPFGLPGSAEKLAAQKQKNIYKRKAEGNCLRSRRNYSPYTHFLRDTPEARAIISEPMILSGYVSKRSCSNQISIVVSHFLISNMQV